MDYFVNKETDVPEQEVFPGIIGRLIHTDNVTIGDFRIKAGTKLPEHQHLHEQTSTVFEGVFDFTVGGQTKRCGPGDVAVIPPNVPHSAIAITDCRVLDVFEPVREDYLAETERLKALAQAYQPIDCGVYDHFEAAIVQRRPVALTYLDATGQTISQQVQLSDLRTENGEEFVQLAGEEWVRLDRVSSLDGQIVTGVCKLSD